jgi:hypothetical protein
VGTTLVHILANNVWFVVVQQENLEGDTPVHDPATKESEVQREIAVILKASTPSRKSKRKAQSADEHSLDRAEQIKAVRNLDFNSEKGNSSTTETLFVHFSNDNVIGNLQSVGISLGNNSEQISLSIERIKEVETERTTLARSNDIISEVFDKEEKEELENEEVDKLILSSLCG